MNLTGQTRSDELAKSSSLADRLTRALLDEIRSGAFQPGQKLPTGQELSRRFGVSLTVVRESLSSLKADGAIETRQGAGAFVSRTARLRPFRIADADPAPGAAPASPEQIFELRTGIEMQAAALAAERGSDAQLAAIRAAHADMVAAVAAGSDAVGVDILFHRRIAEASGNSLFAAFLDFLGDHIRGSIQESRQGDAWPEHQAAVLAEHTALMEAICRRDVAGAREAAHTHMAHCLHRCLPAGGQA